MTMGMSVTGVDDAIGAFRSFKTRFGEDVVYVTGTNVEYAVYVELGTSKMEAQPYLLRATREVMAAPEKHINSTTTAGICRDLALAIERLAKKYAPVKSGNLKGSIQAERVR
jgi:hypothetical protein